MHPQTEPAETTALVPYRGDGNDRSTAWATLPQDERRRRAMEAAQLHDTEALWALTEDCLRQQGRKGARLSASTLERYRSCLVPPTINTETTRGQNRRDRSLPLLVAWTTQNLLRPSRDAGLSWVRQLEAKGLTTSTVRIYVAAAKALYVGLRIAGATTADPFKDVHPAPDPVPRHEKRQPYEPAEVTLDGRVVEGEVKQLLAASEDELRLVVLLGAHAGLRVAEMSDLRYEDIGRRDLVVRSGKGGRRRTVPLSPTLRQELDRQKARTPRGYPRLVEGETRYGWVLPWETRGKIEYRIKRLCQETGVPYKAVHALRHSFATWITGETDLQTAQNMLGHSSITPPTVDAPWSDTKGRRALARLGKDGS